MGVPQGEGCAVRGDPKPRQDAAESILGKGRARILRGPLRSLLIPLPYCLVDAGGGGVPYPEI